MILTQGSNANGGAIVNRGVLTLQNSLVLSNTAAGWGGGMLGLYAPGAPAGWIASVVGAIIVLFIYGLVTKKS